MRLTEHEARERLASVPVARLGTADATGRPHLVPMTFAVDGDRIYTAVDQKPKLSRNLKRLHNIRENPQVAVLADHYEDDWGRLWWVRCDGRATILTDDSALSGPVRLLMDRYEQYRRVPPAGPVIMITVERWTGWSGLSRRMASTAAATRPIRAVGAPRLGGGRRARPDAGTLRAEAGDGWDGGRRHRAPSGTARQKTPPAGGAARQTAPPGKPHRPANRTAWQTAPPGKRHRPASGPAGRPDAARVIAVRSASCGRGRRTPRASGGSGPRG